MTDLRFLSTGFATVTCRIDNVREQCRYVIAARLSDGSEGYRCAKLGLHTRKAVDAAIQRGLLSASADNCAGIVHEE